MWIYKNQEFTDDYIDGHIGFVYLITNVTNNKKYIGKKFFTKASTKQIKGKKKKCRVKSDWINYYGSNIKLKEEIKLLGEENYIREILHLCNTKSECAYFETKEIFVQDALISDDYYNEWVSCKIRKAHLTCLQINRNML